VHEHLALLLAVLLLMASSCSASTEIGLIDQPGASGTGDDGVTADQPSSGELSNDVIYEQIEPSIVFVLAPDGLSSGSGFVIDGGWIVTNAHVVDRHETVRIGRSDGTELGLVPVHAVDCRSLLASQLRCRWGLGCCSLGFPTKILRLPHQP
jgi:S1-C subfamily serine protease